MVVGGTNKERVRTAEHDARFGDDVLYVDRGFLRLRSDVAAGGYHDKRVCFAIQVLDVEPPEKDRRGRNDPLAQGQAFAQHPDDCHRA